MIHNYPASAHWARKASMRAGDIFGSISVQFQCSRIEIRLADSLEIQELRFGAFLLIRAVVSC